MSQPAQGAANTPVQPRHRLDASELEPLPPPVRCKTCRRLVEFDYVESDANGNQDQPLARCQEVHPVTGAKCNFYRFAGQRTPTLSPQPTFATLEDTADPAPAPHICSTEGCGKKNIAKNCDKCKGCCLGRGWCLAVKSHIVKDAPPLPPPPPPPPAGATAAGTSTASATARITPTTNAPATNGARSNSAPALANQARHTSHMLPSFTAQLEVQCALAEDKRKNDKEHIQTEKRLQHTVVVYTWKTSNTTAKSRIYQAGGNGPYFIVTKDVFSVVGLFEALQEGKVEVFFEELAIWTHVGVDYSLSLKHKHHHIYLRHEDATLTIGLKDHVKAVQLANTHICHNLASERTYSCDVYKQHQPAAAPSRLLPAAPQAGPSKVQHAAPVAGRSKRHHESPPLSPDPFAVNAAPLVPRNQSQPSVVPSHPRPCPTPKKAKLEAWPLPPAPTPFVLSSRTAKFEPKPNPRSFSPVNLTGIPSSPPASSYEPSPSPAPQAGPSTQFQGGASKMDAIEIDSDTEIANWRKDYQVYKIITLLRELRTAPQATKTNGIPTHANIFNQHFPNAVYVKSTVNDQKDRLKRAPAHLKKEAIEAKDGYLGKWSVFQQNVPFWEKDQKNAPPASGSTPAMGLGISMGAESIDLTID